MKEIQLTQGKFALVDDDDYERLSQFKWQATKASAKHVWYAGSNFKTEEGSRWLRMHRLIMKATRGQDVDHIDGNGLNNTKANLRVCRHQDNMRNRRPMIGRNQFKGVYFEKDGRQQPWRAHIKCDGKQRRIGRFSSAEDAATAYNFVAWEFFGEFARFNEVDQPWLREIGLA